MGMMRTDTDNAPDVQVTGLVKAFGPVQAVRGIDLTVWAGETVALLGPTGAGKSTTIDSMLGLVRADEGTVSLFGRPPAAAVQAGLVGAMLQEGGQPGCLRVREMVALNASYYPSPLPVDEVLELTGAAAFADRWATQLAGGQRQLARFAAAIVGDPDLLILDEPTACVDAEARHEFWTATRDFTGRGKTVVFSTHQLKEAGTYAGRIALMVGGRIVADGTATEITAQGGTHTIRATLPDVETSWLAALPGVITAQRTGDTVSLTCSDGDLALRALLATFAAARDLEVRGESLEVAFLELTREDRDRTP